MHVSNRFELAISYRIITKFIEQSISNTQKQVRIQQ